MMAEKNSIRESQRILRTCKLILWLVTGIVLFELKENFEIRNMNISSSGVKSISRDICKNMKNLKELVLMFTKYLKEISCC